MIRFGGDRPRGGYDGQNGQSALRAAVGPGIARIDFRRFIGYRFADAAIWFVLGVLVFTLFPAWAEKLMLVQIDYSSEGIDEHIEKDCSARTRSATRWPGRALVRRTSFASRLTSTRNAARALIASSSVSKAEGSSLAFERTCGPFMAQRRNSVVRGQADSADRPVNRLHVLVHCATKASPAATVEICQRPPLTAGYGRTTTSSRVPGCGNRLEVIALIDDPRVIELFLRHLGVPTEVPKAYPAPATARATGAMVRRRRRNGPCPGENGARTNTALHALV